ncbi:MAG TPA: hypothetical protein VE083_06960 [Terriglobales bacterium]|nr:hypothetical protein [Terriglobales bacterium]
MYDEETKTIWLLDTVALDRQGPILAHELTHALQDQNYDLEQWVGRATSRPARGSGRQGKTRAETTRLGLPVPQSSRGKPWWFTSTTCSHPSGATLKDTPGVVASMEESAVTATIDTELMHQAPMMLREAGSFPYREGLFFEADVLAKRGKAAAFQGVFAHPPRNTHEVFNPNFYLEHAPSSRRASTRPPPPS